MTQSNNNNNNDKTSQLWIKKKIIKLKKKIKERFGIKTKKAKHILVYWS